MKKKLTILIFVGLWLMGGASLWGQNSANCSKESFEPFILELAEAGAGRQNAQARFPLTEYYDRKCRELSRPAPKDKVASWGTLLPNQAERAANNYSLTTEVKGDKAWVTLTKDNSWVFEKLEYTWLNNCWYLTGIKIEMDDPGLCR